MGKASENGSLQRIINNQGHYNTHQSPYFFNTILTVSRVQNFSFKKYKCQGGIYND
jgi:hypothetical protein